MSHILQSAPWEQFQQKLGSKTFHSTGDGWSVLGIMEMGPARTPRMYAPYGPSFDTVESLTAALVELEQAAARERAVYLRVEPVGATLEAEQAAEVALKAAGYHKVAHIQPEDTWIVDVDRPWEEVFKDMDPNHRRRYRGMQKRHIDIRSTTDPADIHFLSELMEQVEVRDDIELRGHDYLQAQADILMPAGAATLYLAYIQLTDDEGNLTGEEKVVSADFVFHDDEAVYMMHNGTDGAYYKTGANVAMQVQIVRDACEQGKKRVDFCGIAPEGSGDDHPWAGFSRFKRGFGGDYRHYIGTWEKPINKARYAIYEAARKVVTRR